MRKDNRKIYIEYGEKGTITEFERLKNLMRKILLQLYKDCSEKKSKNNKILRDIKLYLYDQNPDYLFSLTSICNILDLEKKTVIDNCNLILKNKKQFNKILKKGLI